MAALGARLASLCARATVRTLCTARNPSSLFVGPTTPRASLFRSFATEAPQPAKAAASEAASSTTKGVADSVEATRAALESAAARNAASAAKKKGSKWGSAGVWLGALGALGFGAVVVLGQPEPLFQFEKNRPQSTKQLAAQDNVIKAYTERARNRVGELVEFYSAPSREQLLPNPLPEPYQRPYTLILDLDETLVHSDWTKERGWRTMKRPGLNYFLAYLSQYYEIVVFSEKPFFYASPILDKIDNQGCIMYRLFKDSTNYRQGTHYKDLTHINRPLSKVIIVDDDPRHFELQKDNGIKIPPWKGDPSDRTLLELIPFLEMLVRAEVEDVREVLRFYEGKDLIETFKENQRRVAIQQQQQQQKQHSGPSLGSLFRSAPIAPAHAPLALPESPQTAVVPAGGAPAHEPIAADTSAADAQHRPTLWQRMWGGAPSVAEQQQPRN